MENRSAGVLLHISSLPSKYGIGDFGACSYEHIDFMVESSLKYWQILPAGIAGPGNSPYQSISAFAGNPIFINLDKLYEMGFINKPTLPKNIKSFDYYSIMEYKNKYLREAFENFKNLEEIKKWDCYNFCDGESYWMDDYALFKAIKDYNKGEAWNEWENGLKNREYNALENIKMIVGDDMFFHKFVQYLYFKQFFELKEYANSKGIKIIGDIPIFIAYDSADVWSKPELFLLGEDKKPYVVAGVPPDYFSKTGQLWGNPIYNGTIMKQDDYLWWRMRFTVLLKQVDLIRLDHFRAFEAYWSIPASEKTAINGNWVEGPRHYFFDTILKYLGHLPLIAEDLGLITQEVIDLKNYYNFPGMKIIQFAFSDPSNAYLVHNHEENSVVYTGTHDNDTSLGWYLDKENKKSIEFAKQYISFDNNNFVYKFIEYAFSSVARLAIIPMQDFLELDSKSRMNIPGTSQGNWEWKMDKPASDKLSKKIKSLIEKYNRA